MEKFNRMSLAFSTILTGICLFCIFVVSNVLFLKILGNVMVKNGIKIKHEDLIPFLENFLSNPFLLTSVIFITFSLSVFLLQKEKVNKIIDSISIEKKYLYTSANLLFFTYMLIIFELMTDYNYISNDFFNMWHMYEMASLLFVIVFAVYLGNVLFKTKEKTLNINIEKNKKTFTSTTLSLLLLIVGAIMIPLSLAFPILRSFPFFIVVILMIIALAFVLNKALKKMNMEYSFNSKENEICYVEKIIKKNIIGKIAIGVFVFSLIVALFAFLMKVPLFLLAGIAIKIFVLGLVVFLGILAISAFNYVLEKYTNFEQGFLFWILILLILISPIAYLVGVFFWMVLFYSIKTQESLHIKKELLKV